MESAQSNYPMELASLLARRLREAKNDLVARWLERIKARVTLSAMDVFPSESLLNHVPLLIEGIANYVESPGKELDADDPVGPKAMELGELRFDLV